MPIQLVELSGIVNYPFAGGVAANALIRFRLLRPDLDPDSGLVVASSYEVTTNSLGEFALDIWPSARSQTGNAYEMLIYGGGPGNIEQFRSFVSIPDTPLVDLDDILTLTAQPSLPPIIVEGPAGPTGATGPAGPAGVAGPTGPQGMTGGTGPAGPAGPAGADGVAGPGIAFRASVATVGDLPASAPNGDARIVSSNGHLWVRTAGAWVDAGVFRGPAGADGPQGELGPAGPAGPQGPRGFVGNTGAAGAPGAQGEDGATGPQGPRGFNGAPGPQGPAGPAGPAGPTGPQGLVGNTGPAGTPGADGAAGPVGAPGPQGPAGAAGATGPAGPQGPQGPTGPGLTFKAPVASQANLPSVGTVEGEARMTLDTGRLWIRQGGSWLDSGPFQGGTGATGPAGAAGAAGPAGPAGPTGPSGAAGLDGTKVLWGVGSPSTGTGLNGDFYIDEAAFLWYGPKAGGTWPGSPKALRGPTGAAGIQGPAGPAGATGVQGEKGDPGNTGPAGATGATGPAGATGATGPAGAVGATGPQGPVGPVGIVGNLIPSNREPFRKVPGDLYAIASVPRPYELNFDTPLFFKFIEWNEAGADNPLPPASVTLVDESASGGKRFMRMQATNLTTFQHSAIRVKGSFGDGYHRILFRISGTQPSNTQQHGPAIHNRFSISPGVNAGGSSYNLGHLQRGGSPNRIRRIVNGSSTVLVQNATPLPFAHEEWAWAEVFVNGTTIEGRYWKEADPRPASPTVSATDATITEAQGDSGISMLGRDNVYADIAKFVFIPIGGL